LSIFDLHTGKATYEQEVVLLYLGAYVNDKAGSRIYLDAHGAFFTYKTAPYYKLQNYSR
jgi:hypothetical protein